MNGAILLTLLLFAQIAQEMPAQQSKETQAEIFGPDYRIGAGDSLAISVLGSNEFDQTIRVSNSGKIHVPHIGILKVVGMTPFQLQDEIERHLIKQDLIKEPQVQLHVAEHRAHTVYILGEVILQGQFLLTRATYLTDLISLASGFNEVASPVGYLYRKPLEISNPGVVDGTKEPSTEEAIEINFQQLYDGTKPELNVKLRGGDVLYVPARKPTHFFVVGDVLWSGAYEIPFSQQILASQAIARAGGPRKTAKLSKGMLMRYSQEGERQEIALDFNAILRGKDPDFPLMPNDIIFIPGSSAKTLGYGLLGIIPRLAQVTLIVP
ncbi:MAG: polysaccharide biosynthesis/export family protein [Acidobacteria bacterium]|nr:polysaccharide biosynthesis/export family protein [Acidobacteriota bacterium]